MSELIRDPLIITVSEFRKMVGKEAEQYSDEQISKLIVQLDFIAELFIKGKFASKEAAYKKDD